MVLGGCRSFLLLVTTLLFRSPLVIVGFEFCIRTSFVLIGPGCSGT